MQAKTSILIANICLLVLLQLHYVQSSSNSTAPALVKTAAANITKIDNEVKITNAHDLAKMLLKDDATATQIIKAEGGGEIIKTNASSAEKRRKVTPTGDNDRNISKKLNATTAKNVSKELLDKTVSSPIGINGTMLEATATSVNTIKLSKTTIATVMPNKTNPELSSAQSAGSAKSTTPIITKTKNITDNIKLNSTSASAILNSTTTTSTTTTTTTTAKPKKPLITYGIEDFPDLDKEVLQNITQKNPSAASVFPIPEVPEVVPPPNAQPSQEHNSDFPYHNNRDYIVPIVAIMFAVPLTMGIAITVYRRFRDFWSTRHYRRMDFLVDGMYND